MEINYSLLGETIKKVRLSKGYTQEYTASKADISLSHASNVETGKTKVSLPTLVEIANALDVTVDFLLFDNYKHNDNILIQEMINTLKECSESDQRIILETVKTLAENLKKR